MARATVTEQDAKVPAWAAKIIDKFDNDPLHKEHSNVQVTWNLTNHRGSSGVCYYYQNSIVVNAGTDYVDNEYVLLHELAHASAHMTGKAQGYSSKGTSGGSSTGHCVGFYETLFGHTFKTFGTGKVSWAHLLKREMDYMPRNAYKVAKQLKIKGAKAAYQNRNTPGTRWTAKMKFNAAHNYMIRGKSELRFRMQNRHVVNHLNCPIELWQRAGLELNIDKFWDEEEATPNTQHTQQFRTMTVSKYFEKKTFGSKSQVAAQIQWAWDCGDYR
jgi:hypothetical protein